jgi:hypothetical protein
VTEGLSVFLFHLIVYERPLSVLLSLPELLLSWLRPSLFSRPEDLLPEDP